MIFDDGYINFVFLENEVADKLAEMANEKVGGPGLRLSAVYVRCAINAQHIGRGNAVAMCEAQSFCGHRGLTISPRYICII